MIMRTELSPRLGRNEPAAKFIFVHYAHVQRYNKESFVSGMHAKYSERVAVVVVVVLSSNADASFPVLGFDRLLVPARFSLPPPPSLSPSLVQERE